MSVSESQETDDLGLRWPKSDDKLFIEINSFRGAWAAKTTDERLFRQIKGFHRAGDLLVAQSEAEPHEALNLLFPAIFSYRQSLELRLKYLLMAFGPHAGKSPDYKNHGLRDLFTQCKQVILSIHQDVQGGDREALNAVEARIAEFDSIDPGSYAFRFAHDTKGQPIRLGISAIDLSNLRAVVAGLHNFLECVDWHFRYGYGIAPCDH
jgi:hypothetical protein